MIDMNDKFHKKLTKTFRKKFENYSEPYNAENWFKLQQRLISLKRKRIIKYSLAMAASLGLGIIIITLFSIYPEDYTKTRIGRNINKDTRESINKSTSDMDSETVKSQESRSSVMADLTFSKDEVLVSESNIVEMKEEKKRKVSSENKESRLMESLLERRFDIRKPVKLKNNKSLVVENNYYIPASEKKQENFRLGFVFSPLVNQAKNDYDTEIGFAGGVASEISLFSQLSLDVGVLLSRQVIGIDSKIENSQETGVYGGSSSKKMDVQLVVLDIPVNLKYNVMENSGGSIFVSAGISSLVYFDEKYKSTYYAETLLAIDGNSEPIVTVFKEEEKSIKPFNRVDAAKILNLSVGVNYRLKNGMNVQIEPFIKYPVRPITSENIKLGSGGIQFRVYF